MGPPQRGHQDRQRDDADEQAHQAAPSVLREILRPSFIAPQSIRGPRRLMQAITKYSPG